MFLKEYYESTKSNKVILELFEKYFSKEAIYPIVVDDVTLTKLTFSAETDDIKSVLKCFTDLKEEVEEYLYNKVIKNINLFFD